MNSVARYGIFELTLQGPSEGNPFTEVDLRVQFSFLNYRRTVSGFYDGSGVYKVRFMPDREGEWQYTTLCNVKTLDGKTGSFVCTPVLPGRHGPVRVKDRFHFAYDDGTAYYPYGTTAYNWTNQVPEIVAQTIKTLETAGFNKVRYSPFPKHYLYNMNEPRQYAYEGGFVEGVKDSSEVSMPGFFGGKPSEAYQFDFTRPNPAFWQQFEECVFTLDNMGIETDLILFHPYDRWGFAHMSREENLLYLRYIVARLGAVKSIWWSMANEFDLFFDRKEEEWELYARTVEEWDAAEHLRSIHNCRDPYDYARGWITHVSIQRIDYHSHVELTHKWRGKWQKPVVVDEICYEGNIDSGFGNITGEEMTKRFWDVVVRGGYCTHGETYLRDDEVLWWAKGGWLTGTSPERIKFLRSLNEKIGPIDPSPVMEWDLPWGLSGRQYKYETNSPFAPYNIAADRMLCYFSFAQPAVRTFNLPADLTYEIEIIDTWEMTVTKLDGTYSGPSKITLPGKPYVAVFFRKV